MAASNSIAKISAQLNLDVAQFDKQTKDAEKRVRSFAKSISASQTFGQGVGLGTAKRAFGEESMLGQTGKLLRGAGAAAGITLLARQAEAAAKDISGWRQAYKAGEISGKQLAAEVARAIPVIGDLTKAFDAIGEAVGLGPGGPSEAEMQARLDEQNAANADAERRLKEKQRTQARINEMIDEEQYQTRLMLTVEEDRAALEIDRRVELARREGATEKQLKALRQELEIRENNRIMDKEIADAAEAAAKAEEKRRDDFAYALDLEREIADVKKEQVRRTKELEQAGKRSIAVLEMGTSDAYSAILRGGARSRTDAGMITVLQRIAANTGTSARNSSANRVTTVDAL